MEESNIRWGEIIGGLLIIGCSTALVVSLWSQISQIPVLKFLIFTTVTAILFGVGMYTEHRWKLPTTSRGILTIATLLVPLNFLAIAAVSSGETSGVLVLASELLAPAIFLCLVYFAGRIITPGCEHLLAAGVLGSSVGQLLVRHFATVDAAPGFQVLLGAFPVVCYIVAVALALRRVLADGKIEETETTTVFTILGTMSFAALLPFGLLLYKSGPLAMSMMYLAPIVTLWGVPMLATGTVLWRRIDNNELVASRTAGTALGILGLMIALAGMILAWPNPASIIPAALFNVAILTTLAIVLEIPAAHALAAGCFGLAYLVFFHVATGRIKWQNWRVDSLLNISLDISSGQALIGAFVIFLIVSEWLRRAGRNRESNAYFVSACSIGLISLAVVTTFGPLSGNQLSTVWLVYLIYSIGAFWIAWQQKLVEFNWIGAGLVLVTIASEFAWTANFSFPWQSALLVHATLFAAGAIVCSRRPSLASTSRVLNLASLITLGLGVLSFFQTNPWQVTWMQAERVFWIAGILLLSLWLNRRQLIFIALQVSLTAAAILTVKATLQEYDWYTYLPHAFLHPSALQIQGIVLALLSLAWIAARFGMKKVVGEEGHPLASVWRLLDTKYAIDRLIPWVLLGAFVMFAFYGAGLGVVQEFALRGTTLPNLDVAGFPHQEVFSIGSWILLGLLILIMLANAWERRRSVYLIGSLVSISVAIPLLAGRFEADLATATAWRFFAALFFLAGSVCIWNRETIQRHLKSLGWPAVEVKAEILATLLRVVLLTLTCAPILFFTFYPALRALMYAPVQVPLGVFALFDSTVSYALPLIVIALVFVGYAIREGLPRFNSYAALLLNTTVTLAYLLSVVSANGSLDAAVLVRTVQLNAVTLGVHALLWTVLRRRWLQALESRGREVESLLYLEMGVVAVLTLSVIVPTVFMLIFQSVLGTATLTAGDSFGWFTLIVTALTVVVIQRSRSRRVSATVLSAMLLSVVCTTAFGLRDVDKALIVLNSGTTFVACLMFASSWLPKLYKDQKVLSLFSIDDQWSTQALKLSAIVGGVATFLTFRIVPIIRAPGALRTIIPFFVLSALAAALSFRTLKRRYLYLAGILCNLAVTNWWLAYAPRNTVRFRIFLEVNIIAACLAGVLWLLFELRARLLRGATHRAALSFHNVVVVCACALWVLMIVFPFAFPFTDPSELQLPGLTWLAFASTLVLMIAVLWDRHAKYATAGLYFLGLIGAAIGLVQLDLSNQNQTWFVVMFLACYALATSLLWNQRAKLIALAERVGVVPRIEANATGLAWLSVVTVAAVFTTGVIVYWIDLSFESFAFRVSAAMAVGAQAFTFGLLAEGELKERWQRASIATFLVGTILLGWSCLTPNVNATWLNRSVILMVEAFTFTAFYGLALDRIRSAKAEWAQSIRACVAPLLCAGIVSLLFCLGTEISYQLHFGEVRVHPVALVAIGITLVSSVVISVFFALSPNHDPLALSERGRMKYVYAAELMLTLLFMHIRLTMPWLFHGFFEDYWPLVLMAIAFLGVVASESLRRRELLVLAKPIERTGAFLPLLPVVGFWMATSQVDYSSLLFIVGGLYGLLSVLRRSFVFGALAAVAGNAGLWYVLQRTSDYQFLQHPQLWLIPVALSVLLAAYLNEDKLEEDQLAGIRYCSLVTIYASSTADIFINGVANSPWLPLILGAFALAGVFSGIMFRIRGLLLLGSVFLLLSIVTMIWYASANLGWTWLWYVAGIASGATIIFMFAVFEKKRSEVLRMVEGLKEWEV